MSLTQLNWKAENYGQIKRLRIALASQLNEQDFQTRALQKTSFKSGQTWLFDKTNLDLEFSDLFVIQSNENGVQNGVQFKVIVKNDLLKSEFDLPFRRFEGKLLVAEVTTMNDAVATFAPLVCTYEYKQAVTPGGVSEYEFTFRKVSFVNFDDYIFPELLSEEIGDIVLDNTTDGNIKLKVSRLPPFGWGFFTHQIGWSLIDDVSTVTNWATTMDGTAMLINNAPNGRTIYIFVKGALTPTVYKSKEYFVNVENYTFTSNLVAIDPTKPDVADLEEYTGSNVSKQGAGATGAGVTSNIPDFMIGFQPMFPQTNPTSTANDIKLARTKGAKLIQLNIEFDLVFKSLSQYNETNPTLLNKYWESTDYLVNAAIEAGYEYVIFRPILNYDDSRYYFQEKDETIAGTTPYDNFSNATFDLFNEIAKDQFGNPLRVYGVQGKGCGSLGVASAKAKMKGFLQKLLDRYYPILGRKLYGVAPTTTAQQEAGSDFFNYNYVGAAQDYPCEVDYHPQVITQFQDWCVTVKYTSLAAFNAAMGTSWTNKTQILPPKVPVATLQDMTFPLLQAMYNTELFAVWYKFQEKLMFDFHMECDHIIKAKDVNINYIFSPGSVGDGLAAARKTYNTVKMGNYSQIIHTQNGFTSFTGAKIPSGDLVRAYNGKRATELNIGDLLQDGITDPTAVRNMLLHQAKMFRLNKGSILTFVGNSSFPAHVPHFNSTLDLIQELYTWDASKQDTFTEGPTMNVSLKSMVKNFNGFLASYNALNPTDNELGRIKINLTDDL